jgi:hypothetical protein
MVECGFSITQVAKLAPHLVSVKRHVEPFGSPRAEVIEQRSLGAVGADDAAQPQVVLRCGCGRQDHVGAADGGEFQKDGARCVAEIGAALPLFERLPQDISEEPHQDVRQDARLALMAAWLDRQLAFVDAEGDLGFGELDVGLPQRLGGPVADVGAQHAAAFAVA